jgi:uncharacterized membrane protein
VKRENYSQILFGLSLLGIFVAGYILSTRIGGVPLVCVVGNTCDVVQNSPYASIFGVPISAYGLVFYITMAVLALRLSSAPRLIKWVFPLGIAGLLFSIYLTYIQKFLIGAFCFWCVVSALVAASIFVVASLLWNKERRTT